MHSCPGLSEDMQDFKRGDGIPNDFVEEVISKGGVVRPSTASLECAEWGALFQAKGSGL